ncbi:MAG: hypothetical protein R3F43_30395 [bacterium]
MFVTALVDLPPFSTSAARRLGEAAGLPLRRAGDRLQVPGHGLAVVVALGTYAANELRDRLEVAGFHGFVLGPPWPPALRACQLVVLGDALAVTGETGERSGSWARRPAPSSGATCVLPPGSLVHDTLGPDGQPRAPPYPHGVPEGFLRIFTADGPVICLGVGPARPGRAGLRHAGARRPAGVCEAAKFDDRLLARRTQEQILGPDLPPEHHLDLAVLLVARAMEVARPR